MFVFVLFWYALLCALSSFAIILKRKRELVALSSGCLVTVNVMLLLLMVPWVGLKGVIVLFPDHTHLFFLCSIMLNCFYEEEFPKMHYLGILADISVMSGKVLFSIFKHH